MVLQQDQKSGAISLARMTRGLQLLEQGVKIVEIQNGSFPVPSLTRNIVYEFTTLIAIRKKTKEEDALLMKARD